MDSTEVLQQEVRVRKKSVHGLLQVTQGFSPVLSDRDFLGSVLIQVFQPFPHKPLIIFRDGFVGINDPSDSGLSICRPHCPHIRDTEVSLVPVRRPHLEGELPVNATRTVTVDLNADPTRNLMGVPGLRNLFVVILLVSRPIFTIWRLNLKVGNNRSYLFRELFRDEPPL